MANSVNFVSRARIEWGRENGWKQLTSAGENGAGPQPPPSWRTPKTPRGLEAEWGWGGRHGGNWKKEREVWVWGKNIGLPGRQNYK